MNINLKLDPHNINVLMAEKQMTRKQLSETAGINPAYMGKVLKREAATPLTAGRIAAALGVPVAEIVQKGA